MRPGNYGNARAPRDVFLALVDLGIGATIAIFSNQRRRQKRMLKKANIYSCYVCRYCEIRYVHRVQLVSRRVGIQKILDFSRGFCKYFNGGIVDFPRRNCEKFEPRMYT